MTNLFSAFNTVSKKEWEEKIISDLKGTDYTGKLVSNTEEIKISQIYHSDNKTPTHTSSFPENWECYQLIDASNASEGNKRALTALQNNVSGLCFSNPNNLEKLLEGILMATQEGHIITIDGSKVSSAINSANHDI